MVFFSLVLVLFCIFSLKLLFYSMPRYLKLFIISTKNALSTEMSNRITYWSNRFQILPIKPNKNSQSSYVTLDSLLNFHVMLMSRAAPRGVRLCFWRQKQFSTIRLVAQWIYGPAVYCFIFLWQAIRHFGTTTTKKCYWLLLEVSLVYHPLAGAKFLIPAKISSSQCSQFTHPSELRLWRPLGILGFSRCQFWTHLVHGESTAVRCRTVLGSQKSSSAPSVICTPV